MRHALPFLAALSACSGCYLKSFPVTPSVAEESTYRVEAGGAQATAWVVADGYLLTAGHMCELTDGVPEHAKSSTGRTIPVHPVFWEMSSGPEADLCLLKADGPTARPMVLADGMPATGAATHFVGWPQGVYTVSDGTYRGNGWSDAPCDHGASGSAEFTSSGVFGVLTQGHKVGDEWQGCNVTPVSEIKDFLKEAGVSWVSQPDPLPPACGAFEIYDPLSRECYRPEG